MNEEIRSLEPKILWNKFADLNAVPRPSKKEDKVIQFIKAFGNDLGLETKVDDVGNVVIYKPATKGLENRKKIVLQAHLDMVHQKNNDTEFDFDSQGIEMYVDGDWVKAKGTTLGADNGLGGATMMAILESDTIEHPAIEALFTIDEETGMTGAKGLSPDLLQGEILLNLDTEEDDEIGIGCAGGVDITATGSYDVKKLPDAYHTYTLKIKGLMGGHSGMDIIKGLANANKLMNRLLLNTLEKFDLRLSTINGGGLRNAIPRESEATIAIPVEKEREFKSELETRIGYIKAEYASLEPNINIELNKISRDVEVMESKAQKHLLLALAAAHNGVYRMSPEIEDLVEASNNIAKVRVENGEIEIKCLTRSSVESTRDDLANGIESVFVLSGYQVQLSGEYPGWAPNSDSSILKTLDEIYERINGEKANIAACHAGLECGIIGSHYPKMDMISFGPTIRGAHSPDERASISSAQKYWKFLLEVLKNIPEA